MDRNLARIVARVTFDATAEITGLVPTLKQHCAPDEFAKFRDAIASISTIVGQDILTFVYQQHPGLEAEMKDSLDKYRRL